MKRRAPTTTTTTPRRSTASLLLSLSLSLSLASSSSALSNATTASSSASSSASYPLFAPHDPIKDVTCNVEELEDANDSQLHSILSELKATVFFRSFSVDLHERCPVDFEAKSGGGGGGGGSEETTATTNEEEEPSCASEGVPDADPDAEPACHVQGLGGASGGDFLGRLASSSSSSSSSSASRTTTATSSFAPLVKEEEEEEDSCDGGRDELDDDAPALCSVAGASTAEHFKEPFLSLSSALDSLSSSESWESAAQRDTFEWDRPSDPVVFDDDGRAVDCDDDENGIPDTFWMDMCSRISEGEGTRVVNLALNPERNTGYNGTHIWNAIYEENCRYVDGEEDDEQCFEERVLYRLLSGLHASTTLSIARNYYPPSKRRNRADWEPNPDYFMERFGGARGRERTRNLYFSYVVLLRALRRAHGFLYDYRVRTGDAVGDETATTLLRRLLDAHILRSCGAVFDAFDESLMFRERTTALGGGAPSLSLERSFKDVFFNVSSVLDCVRCQQCRLHGKMAMMGYGTALKILFLKEDLIDERSISRNEIVAFVNTLAKMSDALKEVRELTQLYHERRGEDSGGAVAAAPTPSLVESVTFGDTTTVPFSSLSAKDVTDLVDRAVGAVSRLSERRLVDAAREDELVRRALSRDADLLILAKHYGHDLDRLARHQRHLSSATEDDDDVPDAVVVGAGLAGLATALRLLDRGGRVVILEKERRLGGNSAKASSGVNACCPSGDAHGDALEIFRNDTLRSAGSAARPHLIDVLVGRSERAVTWLRERVGVDLSLLAQLGGHSRKRTHRPSNGMAGAEIVYGAQKAVREYETTGRVRILTESRVTQLLRDDDGSGAVVGLEYVRNNETFVLRAPHVVLATGGFAADRSSGSYLERYRPELLGMAATAGDFSTGDGVALATALGAGTVDMDKVQIHPTGWVDPKDPSNPSKVLAAELMRGVGGVLLNDEGERFCDELGTRAHVSGAMLAQADPNFVATGRWAADREVPTFPLVLSSAAAADGAKHVDLYARKGLLVRLEGVDALARWANLPRDRLVATLSRYRDDARRGRDDLGKTVFRGVVADDLDAEVFHAGVVTPVLHYCMGGLTVDAAGAVLDEDGAVVPGLHAAGEVAGGVHGDNRLGGNSLLECTVYGTLVGDKLPLRDRDGTTTTTTATTTTTTTNDDERSVPVTPETLARHDQPEDCWVAIHGVVYDLTDFAEEHPPGAESIHVLAGKDGTAAFDAVHSKGILDDFADARVGVLVATT